MDTSDWVTAAIALVAAGVSVFALRTARWNARSDTRAAIAAEDSATSSRASAAAAQISAQAARDAVREAKRVADVGVEREHKHLRPDEPGAEAFVEESSAQTGTRNLSLVFVPKYTYRVSGHAITVADDGTESSSPLAVGPVLRGGDECRVTVDELLKSCDFQPRPSKVRIRFWPPVDGDPGETWACPCDRAAIEGNGVHWEWNLRVPRLPTPMAVWA